MTLNEEDPVRLQVWRRGLGVEDARITEPDLEAQNGVIHIINKVITPSNQSIDDVLRSIPGQSFEWVGFAWVGSGLALDLVGFVLGLGWVRVGLVWLEWVGFDWVRLERVWFGWVRLEWVGFEFGLCWIRIAIGLGWVCYFRLSWVELDFGWVGSGLKMSLVEIVLG